MKRFLAFWFFLPAAFARVETTTSITGTVADQWAPRQIQRHAVCFLIQGQVT